VAIPACCGLVATVSFLRIGEQLMKANRITICPMRGGTPFSMDRTSENTFTFQRDAPPCTKEALCAKGLGEGVPMDFPYSALYVYSRRYNLPNKGVVKVSIVAIRRDDNSGESWIAEGDVAGCGQVYLELRTDRAEGTITFLSSGGHYQDFNLG
jgi:hypothetical protein